MVRSPCIEKNGLKKGAWTKEEDKKLIDYITRYGHWNWQLLPKFAGLERCGKSCRLRWLNYLRPNLKRGNYTQQEDETIIKLHRNLGSRWSVIAAQLPGRSDNEIKNHWNTNLKKRSQQDSNPFQSLHTSQDLSPSSSTTTEYITVSNKENLVTEDECAFWDADIDLMSRNFSLETYMLNISYVPDETDHFSQVELWSNDI